MHKLLNYKNKSHLILISIAGLIIFLTLTLIVFSIIQTFSSNRTIGSLEKQAVIIASEKQEVLASGNILPVLSLRYFPVDESGQALDPAITGSNKPLSEMRTRVDATLTSTINARTDSTKYRGYKDSNATAYINYSLNEDKEFLVPLPLSTQYAKRVDHFKIFSDVNIGVANVCDYIDNQGVKEVWIWMYHTASTEPIESNMSPKTGGTFGTYGYRDISNSSRVDDLPRCAHTYTVYEYNYFRGLPENLENHGHQIEHVLNWIDGRDVTPRDEWQNLLFWGKFVGSDSTHKIINPGCGWTHYPPNGVTDYDWANETDVLSDCEDWKPDGTGTKKIIDCHTWAGSDCRSPLMDFKLWWMQNIPGLDNGLVYNGEQLRNWWDFIYDFDSALAQGKSLTQPTSPDTQPPIVSITSPSEGSTVSDSVSVKADASDNVGVSKVEFIVDGVIKGEDTTAPFTYSWNSASYSNGSHSVKAKAYDAAGNNSVYSISVTVSNNVTTPPPTKPPKLGDLNGDNKVNIFDLSILLSRWGTKNKSADLNDSGRVDIFDLSILLSHWGK